ncbi:methenyltetrahydromethanopterin cyclohydrolase [Candidatus Formimonas warabiya]|uniref:Methenyltetrahydromethanopterin cyclohydrolase n=1 Tax=Formimonas warabiya TaxID=1761012 RepID=A0A3G1KNL6_FORW1|nr:methenyltetrahydromethanopterin cyclohydrolase [Candidatus Formimonas warabiya]ATW24047.1 methenyltetrahydromethanopterin cyclohydrolase [Candidatus Formimonas warabiya]
MPIQLNDMPALSPNLRALPFVNQLIAHREQFKVEVSKISGVTIIDCGVSVPGGWETGLIFAKICLGGLAKVKLHWADFRGLRWPALEVITDHPVRACMASQYAGWFIKRDKFSAMGSGPARAVVHSEELFGKLGYRDSAQVAVLCLESRKLPPEGAVNLILEKCGCQAENLYILVAPTASIVGSVQIAARSVETGLHKMMELGYDLGLVERGWGISPLAPVAADDLSAIGRTNDAILYGATVQYQVQDEDACLKALVGKVPSASSRDYGLPFRELFDRVGNFYDIDPLLFSPAEVWLSNEKSGCSFHAGEIRPDLLRKSFQLGS